MNRKPSTTAHHPSVYQMIHGICLCGFLLIALGACTGTPEDGDANELAGAPVRSDDRTGGTDATPNPDSPADGTANGGANDDPAETDTATGGRRGSSRDDVKEREDLVDSRDSNGTDEPGTRERGGTSEPPGDPADVDPSDDGVARPPRTRR
jgi:hypothetical protein